MTETTLIVNHPVGLHARPAATFYQKTREFKSRVTIQNLSRPNSKEVMVSPFNLLQIGVSSGHEVRLRAEGEDEQEAIAALSTLIKENFGET
jgi:phosphocarrier protein HPr